MNLDEIMFFKKIKNNSYFKNLNNNIKLNIIYKIYLTTEVTQHLLDIFTDFMNKKEIEHKYTLTSVIM